MRQQLTPDRAVYIGDLCYHGERMAVIHNIEENNKVSLSYLDAPPRFNIQAKQDNIPRGFKPCTTIPDIHLIDKTDLSDLSDEERRGLWLYATRGK